MNLLSFQEWEVENHDLGLLTHLTLWLTIVNLLYK